MLITFPLETAAGKFPCNITAGEFGEGAIWTTAGFSTHDCGIRHAVRQGDR